MPGRVCHYHQSPITSEVYDLTRADALPTGPSVFAVSMTTSKSKASLNRTRALGELGATMDLKQKSALMEWQKAINVASNKRGRELNIYHNLKD